MQDSLFEFNAALDDGGHVQTETEGTASVRRCQFSKGFAVDKGGAMVLQNAAQTVEASTFTANTAGCFVGTASSRTPRTLTCAPCTVEAAPPVGDIARCFLPPGTTVRSTVFAKPKGGAVRVSNGTFTLTDSLFDANTNLGGDGGAIDVATPFVTVTITGCLFKNNVAKRNDRFTG